MKFQLVEVKGSEYCCLCPWHDDKNPSLFINIKENKAICFAGCFSGTARKAIEKLLGYVPQNPETAFEQVQITRRFRDWSVRSQTGSIEYMYERGFTEETIKAWAIYYDADKDSIAIPAFKRSGKKVGTIYRQTSPEAVPKYLYSPGFKVSRTLFGTYLFEPLPAEVVYIVEGPLDCIWMWQCGYKSTVALLGSRMSIAQTALMGKLGSDIGLCMDNDVTGKKSTGEIATNLVGKGHKVWVVTMLEGKKDVQEHNQAELDEIMKCPIPFLAWKLA